LALAVPVVLIGWIVVMAVVMRFSDAAPAAVVIFPDDQLMNGLPDKVAVIRYGRVTLTLANRKDLAADLYAAGALLVLPAGLTGCLPLTSDQRAVLAPLAQG